MPTDWSLEEALAEDVNIDRKLSQNLVNLIEKDQCTLPFIARYKKDQTSNISLEKLRKVFESLQQLKEVQKKVDLALAKIEKTGNLTLDVKASLRVARTTEDIEIVTAPFKATGTKRTLAGKACQLGLDVYGQQILEGQQVNLNLQITDEKGKPLPRKEILLGVQHIIADIISKDADILTSIKKEFTEARVCLVTSKKSTTKREKAGTESKKPAKDNSHKYEQYYDKCIPVRSIHSYQVLAINRAESHKYLTVKLTVPDSLESNLYRLCQRRWSNIHRVHRDLFSTSVSDAYKRLLLPMLTRQCRSRLKQEAEMDSVDTFGENLKSLLLQPPCRGGRVLGVDPGFANGCKLAVVSQNGELLDVTTVYLHSQNKERQLSKLSELIKKYNCEMVALGNGTGCRETEALLSDSISSGMFSPVDVKYCIVNEDGSSVYSVSPLAEKELPGVDQNHRSAVSIARRLQDPLIELVKIDPQHIGVGMYQHDIAESKLKCRLESVLSECVSFVGLDINTATEHVLSHVSGLNKSKAAAILKERERVGGRFICREQLLNVKGLGAKCYEQCAGFIIIKSNEGASSILSTPKGVNGRKKSKISFVANPLDQTMIHPASYDVALRLMNHLNIDVKDLGTEETTRKVTKWKWGVEMKQLANSMNTDVGTMSVIVEALEQKLNHDIRDHMTKPLFKTGKTCVESLRKGDNITGVVRNLAKFGAFVDLGVKFNGLIHSSKMNGQQLAVGNQVKVKILEIKNGGERISLKLLELLK